MINFKRLDHIQICIPVGKEKEAREFYTGIIGLTEIPKPQALVPNGGLWYQIADIQFHIGVESEMNKSKRHPAFEVTNLDEARQHLEKKEWPLKKKYKFMGKADFHLLIRLEIGLSCCKNFD